MSVHNIKDYILEAIDRLRIRKARPNIERICFYVQRNYSLKKDYVSVELRRLVRAGAVLEVIYKGNVSYRNPASRSKVPLDLLQRRAKSAKETLTDVQSAISKAFAVLLLEDEDYLDSGIPGEILVQAIVEDGLFDDSSTVWNMLNSETSGGFLIKLPNGNYSLNNIPMAGNYSPNDIPVAEMCSSGSSQTSSSNAISLGSTPKRSEVKKIAHSSKSKEGCVSQSFRVGGRMKKPKKVFDPSDNYLPKRRLGCTSSQMKKAITICSVCTRPIHDKPISCSSCTKNAHSSCVAEVEWSDSYIWMCKTCQFCSVCRGDGESGPMLTCISCSDSCHLTCLDPPATDPPDYWKCLMCANDLSDEVLIESQNIAKPSVTKTSNLNVSEIASWTIDEVFEYLSGRGYQTQAEAFKENDIDGLSLLLLTRSDVLYGLRLKLGPALKAYKQVHILQTQCRDRAFANA